MADAALAEKVYNRILTLDRFDKEKGFDWALVASWRLRDNRGWHESGVPSVMPGRLGWRIGFRDAEMPYVLISVSWYVVDGARA